MVDATRELYFNGFIYTYIIKRVVLLFLPPVPEIRLRPLNQIRLYVIYVHRVDYRPVFGRVKAVSIWQVCRWRSHNFLHLTTQEVILTSHQTADTD